MEEKLTRELIETHLMSFINIMSQQQDDGVTRWAWTLSEMAEEAYNREVEENEFEFRFSSYEAARNFAFGWIRRNRPEYEKAAVREAKEGIQYRASKRR